MSKIFNFQRFSISRNKAGMKLSTDAVLLGTWTATFFPNKKYVLDLGTGTGILSLLYADLNKQSQIHGIDIDKGAIEDATLNFQNSPYKDRLSTSNINALNFKNTNLPWGTNLDLIICNPPYFTPHDNISNLNPQRYNARHNDGLSPETIIYKATEWLSEDGIITLMYPANFSDTLLNLVTKSNLSVLKIEYISSVYGKKPYLILLALQKHQSSILTNNNVSLPLPTYQYLYEPNPQSPKNINPQKPKKSSFWHSLSSNIYLHTT